MIESHARRKKRQPIPKRFSGDGSAPPRFLVAVNFAFRRLAFATRPLCFVTSPLPKKSLLCKSFSGALFYSVFLSFLCLLLHGVCLAAAGEARRTCLCQAHATVPKWFFDDHGFLMTKALKIIFWNLHYKHINHCIFVEKRV